MFLDYLVLKKKLINKLSALEKKINQPIIIRDIIFYPTITWNSDKGEEYGEAKTPSANYSNPMKDRLVDHIQSLHEMANICHRNNYCVKDAKEEVYNIKKEHVNTITRLSLPEFSLYGKEPITNDEFEEIVTKIRYLAEQGHKNVHLLLGSFAVISKTGEILNISLYVQEGENSKIDCICKAQANKKDISYPNNKLSSHQKIGEKTKTIAAFIASNKDDVFTVSNKSVLEIETLGGAKFTQAIDVCFDHSNKHSLTLLSEKIKSAQINANDILPKQVDHIVTSNSVELDPEAKITSLVHHVDPRPHLIFDAESRKRELEKQLLLDVKQFTPPLTYPNMKATNLANGEISVTNPPFGDNYRLKIFKERPLGGFIAEIESQIQTTNVEIKAKHIQNILSINLQGNKVQAMEDASAKTFKEASDLIAKLTKKCKPTPYESLFKPQGFYVKEKAHLLISIYENTLTTMNQGALNAFLIDAPSWADDLKSELKNLNQNKLPSSLLDSLIKMLDEFQQVVADRILPENRQEQKS